MKRGKVKKSVKKKANASKCKPCKPFFDDKKLLVVAIAAFFVFAFLLAFVNVPQNATITGGAVEGLGNISTTEIGTFLTNFMNPEQVNATVVKWILFFTFALGIWGVLSLFKIKNAFFNLLALPISFAMVYFLKAEEIFAGLIGYSAAGMTILVVGPLLAIVFFSVRFLEGKLTAPKIIAQLMVWYFYLAFLIYFLIRAFTAKETYSLGILIIIGIGIIITLIIIWKNKLWRNWIAVLSREGVAKGIEDVQDALGAKEKGEAKRGKKIIKASEEFEGGAGI